MRRLEENTAADRLQLTPEVETVVGGDDLQPVPVIECKYDRVIPGGTNKPRTNDAGGLFKETFIRS